MGLIDKNAPVYSIIVFGNQATLKNVAAGPNQNTFIVTRYRLVELVKKIIDEHAPELTPGDVEEICRQINSSRLNLTAEEREKHIAKINNRTGKARVLD